jgi:peptidoglycan L-alanyl-D-glutamate endopeptidase CwlK
VASRKLSDLHPDIRLLAEKFLDEAEDEGIDVLVTCTYRSGIEQAALYAQGRTAPGKIVTNAKPGESLHNALLNGNPGARAFDVVPMVMGKPMWDADHPHWQKLGEIGKSIGLEWAGEWKRFREYPHFQLKETT